jgi:1-acyl-sn-glycerol-3-phosphate acyltransferase
MAPQLPDRSNWIQFKKGPISSFLLKLLGWKLNFEGLPTPRGILVVYPHTSNVDFLVGITAKFAIGLPVCYLAKDSLFKIPLIGAWMRHVGGRPVVRNSPQGYVSEIAQEMAKADFFWLVITPEGTRKKTPGLRSGFYHLALKTGYPVGFTYIDYAKKQVGVTQFAYLSGNEEQDLAMMRKQFEGIGARYPENTAPIEFWTPPERKKRV